MIIPYIGIVTVFETLSLPSFQNKCPKRPHEYFMVSEGAITSSLEIETVMQTLAFKLGPEG